MTHLLNCTDQERRDLVNLVQNEILDVQRDPTAYDDAHVDRLKNLREKLEDCQ